MDDVCFSGASLAVLGAIGTVLTGAIGVLFRALLAAKDNQILLTEQVTRALAIAEYSNDLAAAGAAEVKRGRR